MNKLKLYFDLKKYNINDYKMDVNNDKGEIISTIDFKNDNNFNSINNVNEFLINNLIDNESIEIFIEDEEDICKKNMQWKKIIELIKELWKNEFEDIKKELNNLIINETK